MEMKNKTYRMAFAAITAVCLGAQWDAACAQNSSTVQAGASSTAVQMPAVATPTPALPSGVSEVMKLFKGGITADIMVSYINNSPLSFYLSADNLIALQNEGVPAPVLMAMIQRFGELQRQTQTANSAASQYQAQSTPAQYAPQQYAAPVQVPAPEYLFLCASTRGGIPLCCGTCLSVLRPLLLRSALLSLVSPGRSGGF